MKYLKLFENFSDNKVKEIDLFKLYIGLNQNDNSNKIVTQIFNFLKSELTAEVFENNTVTLETNFSRYTISKIELNNSSGKTIISFTYLSAMGGGQPGFLTIYGIRDQRWKIVIKPRKPRRLNDIDPYGEEEWDE